MKPYLATALAFGGVAMFAVSLVLQQRGFGAGAGNEQAVLEEVVEVGTTGVFERVWNWAGGLVAR